MSTYQPPTVEETAFHGLVVTVYEPEEIMRLEASGWVSRLRSVDQLKGSRDLFTWSPYFHKGQVHCPFQPVTKSQLPYNQDLLTTFKQILTNLKGRDYVDLVDLIRRLHSDRPEKEAEKVLIKAISQFGLWFPDDRKIGALKTLPLISDLFDNRNLCPYRGDQIREAYEKIKPTDVHDLHGQTVVVRLLADLFTTTVLTDHPVLQIVCNLSPVDLSLRFTTLQTDLGGLLPQTVPADTIVLYSNRYAARKSQNIGFVFGTRYIQPDLASLTGGVPIPCVACQNRLTIRGSESVPCPACHQICPYLHLLLPILYRLREAALASA